MNLTKIGLISDTHNLLRTEALRALAGVDHILHLGDIGNPDILEKLSRIAPVTAVRGNNDQGEWAKDIAALETLQIKGHNLCLIHDVKDLPFEPSDEGIDVVISGHSHQPRIQERDTVLYVNPGSAGPRRFKLPVSVGFLEFAGGQIRARIQELPLKEATTA